MYCYPVTRETSFKRYLRTTKLGLTACFQSCFLGTVPLSSLKDSHGFVVEESLYNCGVTNVS